MSRQTTCKVRNTAYWKAGIAGYLPTSAQQVLNGKKAKTSAGSACGCGGDCSCPEPKESASCGG